MDNLLELERKKKFPQGDFNGAMNDKDGLLNFLLPDQLGTGFCRSTHSLVKWSSNQVRPTVVKCAIQYEGNSTEGIRSNLNEFDVWCYVMNRPHLARWFAPVRYMSDCCKFIIMDKCEKLDEDDMPDFIPDFLLDVHHNNLGMLDGRVVCLDYGQVNWSRLRSSDKPHLVSYKKKYKEEVT